QVAKLVVLKLRLTEYGLEGAGCNFCRDSLTVEPLALDRLLQDFQRGVGDDACPVVRRLAGHGLVALAVVCNRLAGSVDASNTHYAGDRITIVLGIDREG